MSDLELEILGDRILLVTLDVTLALLSAAFLVVVWRIIRGPTLPDRVLGLDALVSIAIGFIATIGIRTGYALYVDIAIALGLVGFLATVALARFIHMRGMTEEDIAVRERESERETEREMRVRREVEREVEREAVREGARRAALRDGLRDDLRDGERPA